MTDPITADDATLSAVAARVAAGVAAHREATRDEWMAVLRSALRYRAAFEALVDEREARGRESMSLGAPQYPTGV
jgi:thiamine biosynthesis protein ThiC